LQGVVLAILFLDAASPLARRWGRAMVSRLEHIEMPGSITFAAGCAAELS
jgi:hypothetical protein